MPGIGTWATVAIAAFTAVSVFFAWRLYRLERYRERPDIEIEEARTASIGAVVRVVNKGGHDTAIRAVDLVQELENGETVVAEGTQPEPWDTGMESSSVEEEVLVRSGGSAWVKVRSFSGGRADSEVAKEWIRVTPVLGEPVRAPFDRGE